MSTPTINRTIFLSNHSYNIQKVGASSATKNSVDSYEATVGYEVATTTINYAIIKFDLPSTGSGRQVLMASNTISEATFYFYVYSGDTTPIQEIEVVYITDDPATASADDLYTAITAADALDSKIINTDNKTLVSVDISNLSVLETKLATTSAHYTLAIRRKNTLTSDDGEVKIGGLTQLRGNDTSWAAATDPLIAEPAYLYMVSSRTIPVNQRFYMKYTTLDPTSEQSTPSNSIGGYIAPSPTSVYDEFQILEDISPIQTSFYVTDLPDSSSGLIQAGLEIMKYEGIDSSNDQITSVTRGISPGTSFAYNPYNDFAHYLDVDKLFDKKPNSSLVQYRCVAIYLSATAAITVSNIKVSLIKNEGTHTNIDIGIEVPETDRHEGTLSANVASGDTTFSSSTGGSFGLYGFDADYFEGAYVVLDTDGTAFETFITSHSDGGSAEDFVVADTLPALSSGDTVRIWPAAGQRISSEDTRPVENSGRFLGFFSEGGIQDITLNERGTDMLDGDLFYIWIRRELSENTEGKPTTGATILVEYDFEDAS